MKKYIMHFNLTMPVLDYPAAKKYFEDLGNLSNLFNPYSNLKKAINKITIDLYSLDGGTIDVKVKRTLTKNEKEEILSWLKDMLININEDFRDQYFAYDEEYYMTDYDYEETDEDGDPGFQFFSPYGSEIIVEHLRLDLC